MSTRRFRRAVPAAFALAMAGGAAPAAAQWVQQHEQFYLPAEHNWVFRRDYPAADRLFNAFDYGHAILYEELWRRPATAAQRLEGPRYEFLTRRLLTAPPRVPLEEAAIEIGYARLAPEAKLMFEWAHILHRQLYDVLADERLSQDEKDAAVAELVAYYKTRPDLAFSSRPKNMELMEGQYYSTAFRRAMPKFNGLIWAYHWLQVGLYEPLLVGRTVEERQTGVVAAVTRFRQMLENAPENMPRVMPMTAAIAPEFTRRYPEAAIIFDNLHGMHDVISDILASPQVPRERKREEILRAAARYRDDTSFVMTEDEWRGMALAMGVQNMGGPVMGFLAGFPEPTVERGAVLAHAGHGAAPAGDAPPAVGNAAPAPSAAMPAGHQHGAMQPAAAPAPAPTADPHQHGAMQPAAAPAGQHQHGTMPVHGDAAHAQMMHELHMRMMGDPVIRQRVMEDTAMHGMMMRMMEQVPAGHREEMMRTMHGGADARAGHAAMPGASAEDVQRAMDFVALLLSDPQIEQRVHSDPELHRLWSDPEVQRRLAELRARQGQAAPEHRH